MKLPQLSATPVFSAQLSAAQRPAAFREGIMPQNYALTGCNLGTGVVSTDFLNVVGYGPKACLKAHEDEHITYETPCCARAKKCFDKTSDDSCLNAYNAWTAANINDNECKAYTTEIGCINNALLDPNISSRSATMLGKRLVEATQYQTHYCGLAGPVVACPFKANGDII